MSDPTLALLMFGALFLCVFLGIPVAFSLFGVAVVFGYTVFGFHLGAPLYNAVLQVSSQTLLTAVPAFVFMGAMLDRSGIAERLFRAVQLWLGRLPGGLAVTTMGMASIFAAATGVVGAVEIVIGMMAIPAMMSYGYNKALISGTICAGGSLGTMIPPSLVVVIYASVASLPVGKMFAGMILPAALMVGLFLVYILGRCIIRPADGPPADEADFALPFKEKLAVTASAFVPTFVLIALVLGSIIVGVASPTEAASLGALGAVALSLVYRQFSWSSLYEALRSTIQVTSMIMLVVVFGTMFTNVFRVLGGSSYIQLLVTGSSFSPEVLVLILLAIVFVAGCVLDWVSVVLICAPIFLPIIDRLDVDPLWFAIAFIVVIQTSYLTPPMSPTIFYLRAVAPPEISYWDMYKGIFPFVIIQVFILAIILLFPEVVTFWTGGG